MNFENPTATNESNLEIARDLAEKMLAIRTTRPDLLTGVDLDMFDKIKDFLNDDNAHDFGELNNLYGLTNKLAEKLLIIRTKEPLLLTGIDLDNFEKIRGQISDAVRLSLTEMANKK
jgi:hypothetical protein